MVSSINSSNINSLQQLRASQAFKSINKNSNVDQSNSITDIDNQIAFESDEYSAFGTNLSNKLDLLQPEKMDEIQNIANNLNTDVSEADIKYGLMYGRSVLVNYSA